jgi:NADH:ubiquinone oxidoreductase subunit 5 (subunit L)/multisubunit Na+/H+ antiporter MnhA subunit
MSITNRVCLSFLVVYLLIVAFPLIGTIFAGLFGRWFGGRGAGYITIVCITSAFLLSCFAFYEVALNKSVTLIQIQP